MIGRVAESAANRSAAAGPPTLAGPATAGKTLAPRRSRRCCRARSCAGSPGRPRADHCWDWDRMRSRAASKASFTFDLPQQALIPAQVNKPGVPPVGDLLKHPGLGAPREAWCAPAGFIDSQGHHRSRLLRQHRGGVVEESRVDHRPGQAEVPRGLCHRRGTEGHRASRRGAKPASHSPTRGDPRYRLGERGTRTPVPGTVTRVSATPTVPAQDREHHDAGGHAPFHRGGGHTARRTRPRCVHRHHVHYPGAVRTDFDPIDHRTGKPTTASCRSFTPVARHIDCLDNSHDHDGLRAPDVRATTPQSDHSASPMERAETTLAR
jgi:hypothetical protein